MHYKFVLLSIICVLPLAAAKAPEKPAYPKMPKEIYDLFPTGHILEDPKPDAYERIKAYLDQDPTLVEATCQEEIGEGEFPLYISIRARDMPIFNLVMSYSPQLNRRVLNQSTPLQFAIFNKRPQKVKALLDAGAAKKLPLKWYAYQEVHTGDAQTYANHLYEMYGKNAKLNPELLEITQILKKKKSWCI